MNSGISDDIDLVIYGFRALGNVHFAEEFFHILKAASYLPNKIGMHEPIKTPFSLEEAKKIWIGSEKDNKTFGGIAIKGKRFFGDIRWDRTDNSNTIGLYLHRDLLTRNNGSETVIDLAKKLFLWANGVWGYVCHSSYQNSKFMYTPGLTYRTCIGGIPWMALFGPPYVDMFGKEVIQTAPCRVQEFAEDRFMLLTSNEPVEMNREMLEKQEKVKKHLGENAFCRHDHPTKLTMEDLKAGKGKTSKEGYRSPDLSAYSKGDEKQVGSESSVIIEDVIFGEETLADSQRKVIREEFANLITRGYPEIRIVGERDDSIVLTVKGAEIECSFENICKACECVDSFEERKDIYEHLLESFKHSPTGTQEIALETHGSKIMPRLAPRSILKELGKRGRIPQRPFADTGLIVTYVLDFPESVMYISDGLLAKLNLDEDSLYKLAITNLERTFPVEVLNSVLDQQQPYTVKIMDSHDAARILLIPKYLPEGAEVAVLIPDRDTLVITPLPPDGDWTTLKKLARSVSGRSLFSKPVLVSNSGFLTVK